MSRSGRAAGRARARRAAGLLLVLLGCLLGAALGLLAGDRFDTPDAVQPDRWRTVSPALDETLNDPLLGRGSHVIGGDLVIREHAFHAADILVPQIRGELASIELTLADDSGPTVVVLSVGEGRPRIILRLSPTQYMLTSRGPEWEDRGTTGPWLLRSDTTGTRLLTAAGEISLSPYPAEGLELTTSSAEARIAGLVVRDAAGGVLFADDFGPARPHPATLVAGTLFGGLWGLCFAAALPQERRGLWLPLLAAALPLLVLAVPERNWLIAVERLYLSRTAYWVLARDSLILALLPLATLALLRAGLLRPRVASVDRRLLLAWAVLSVVAAALASRHLHGPALLLALPGAGWLLAGPWLSRRLGLDPQRGLLQDLPGLLFVSGLGWGLGLLPQLCWRLLLVIGGVRLLLDRAPRMGANSLFLLLLALPPASELFVRSSYLGDAWDISRLSGEAASATDWRLAQPFWTGTCGPDDAGHALSVAFAGGSSTGGAYQFRGQPDAFFPARVHARLCERLPADTALHTGNYGDGGRDSFTISRSIERMLDDADPDVLVLYLGVNDLLTSGGSMSRKDRAERLSAWQGGASGLVGLAARSRLLTGLSLILRPLRSRDGQEVPEVPLSDARDNLDMIATAAAGRGVPLLVVTEQLRGDFQGELDAYDAMLRAVAADHDNVAFFDLTAALAPSAETPIMADRNHLNKQGSDLVAELLTPAVAQALGLP